MYGWSLQPLFVSGQTIWPLDQERTLHQWFLGEPEVLRVPALRTILILASLVVNPRLGKRSIACYLYISVDLGGTVGLLLVIGRNCETWQQPARLRSPRVTRVGNSIDIKVPKEEIFAYVSDLEAGPEWVNWAKDTEVTSTQKKLSAPRTGRHPGGVAEAAGRGPSHGLPAGLPDSQTADSGRALKLPA